MAFSIETMVDGWVGELDALDPDNRSEVIAELERIRDEMSGLVTVLNSLELMDDDDDSLKDDISNLDLEKF